MNLHLIHYMLQKVGLNSKWIFTFLLHRESHSYLPFEELKNTITDILYVEDLVSHVIFNFLGDQLDFFKLSTSLQHKLEVLFCRQNESGQWMMFNQLHGPGDKACYDHTWIKCGRPWRANGNPTEIVHHIDVFSDLEIRNDAEEPYEVSWSNEFGYHRDHDLPAIESKYTQEWYWNGIKHRDDDKPAQIINNTLLKWFVYGLLHRDGDKPSICCTQSNYKQYYKHGKLHRDGDKPAMIDEYGWLYWYQNGNLHRENGKPAIVSIYGVRQWYEHGKFINIIDNVDDDEYNKYVE